MLNDPEKESENTPVEIRCYFVRARNALAVRGQFEALYMDLYLHLMQHRLQPEEADCERLKEALAAMTLHLASRPRAETAAWTVNFHEPGLNLFVTGSNPLGNLTGRVFTEGVKRTDRNLFFSQVTGDRGPQRRSTVEFGDDEGIFEAVETYYRMSEQRPARYFRHGAEDFVMITAQPDCDMPWFLTLDDEIVRHLDETEELSLLETRVFRFDCGCDLDRIYPVIARLSREALAEVFSGDDETAEASCPRCGARYALSREGFEAFLKKGRA